MIRFVPWSEVGTIEVSPGDDVVEVGEFELAEEADTLWVRMTNTGTPGPWPWSYGILSFKTDEGQPLGSIKAYNSFDGEVFRLGVGLAPSVRAGVLTFEPRGFNMAWINEGNPWELKFEAQSGGAAVSSSYWNRDPENGLITPKTSGDNLDMTPGWIKAKNLILTDGEGADDDRDVAGYQQGTWTPTPLSGDATSIVSNVFMRIGNMVTIQAKVGGFTDRSSANALNLDGVPYPHAATISVGACRFEHIATTGSAPIVPGVTSGSVIAFWSCPTSAPFEIVSHGDISSSPASLTFTITYLTDDTSWDPGSSSLLARPPAFNPEDLYI